MAHGLCRDGGPVRGRVAAERAGFAAVARATRADGSRPGVATCQSACTVGTGHHAVHRGRPFHGVHLRAATASIARRIQRILDRAAVVCVWDGGRRRQLRGGRRGRKAALRHAANHCGGAAGDSAGAGLDRARADGGLRAAAWVGTGLRWRVGRASELDDAGRAGFDRSRDGAVRRAVQPGHRRRIVARHAQRRRLGSAGESLAGLGADGVSRAGAGARIGSQAGHSIGPALSRSSSQPGILRSLLPRTTSDGASRWLAGWPPASFCSSSSNPSRPIWCMGEWIVVRPMGRAPASGVSL